MKLQSQVNGWNFNIEMSQNTSENPKILRSMLWSNKAHWAAYIGLDGLLNHILTQDLRC